ncbi:PepSY domain-containing protein, partial [Clostridium sp.]|uniref:PepSY domain-containing protein n=1 Tax=Clostridium sp. TaxID=1506 RepID=UPI002612D52F
MKRLKLATVITIISISLMGCSNSEVLNNKTVTIDEAKEIALKHAGVTSDQVSFIKAEMDLDSGIQKYDIEFYHGSKEYDYEINSANGEIIKYDYDIEYNNNVNNTNNT